MTLRNGWQKEEKDAEKTLVCDMFCRVIDFFFFKICVKDVDVWWKVFSNKITVTLSKQSLPSSFLSRPVAFFH